MLANRPEGLARYTASSYSIVLFLCLCIHTKGIFDKGYRPKTFIFHLYFCSLLLIFLVLFYTIVEEHNEGCSIKNNFVPQGVKKMNTSFLQAHEKTCLRTAACIRTLLKNIFLHTLFNTLLTERYVIFSSMSQVKMALVC